MNIVPIIADGRIVKSHTEYAITNDQWKLMCNGLGLWDYLTTLQLMESPYPLMNFAGIRDFYLRERHNSLNFDRDPWNRPFVVMPPSKQKSLTSVYRYYSYSSVVLYINVDVIVTTVHRDRVYCVDVTKML
jgi:hypothetical protein